MPYRRKGSDSHDESTLLHLACPAKLLLEQSPLRTLPCKAFLENAEAAQGYPSAEVNDAIRRRLIIQDTAKPMRFTPGSRLAEFVAPGGLHPACTPPFFWRRQPKLVPDLGIWSHAGLRFGGPTSRRRGGKNGADQQDDEEARQVDVLYQTRGELTHEAFILRAKLGKEQKAADVTVQDTGALLEP